MYVTDYKKPKICKMFRLLSKPKAIELLQFCSDGEKTVKEIDKLFRIKRLNKRPVTNQYIIKLRCELLRVGLLKSTHNVFKDKRIRVYFVPKNIKNVIEIAENTNKVDINR